MRTVDAGIEAITHLAFSPDGTLLAAAGKRGVALGPWPAIANGRGAFAIGYTREKVAQLAWHPNSYYFALASFDTAIHIWNRRLRARRELLALNGQSGHMACVAYSPKGERLAFGGGWWEMPGSAVVVQTRTWKVAFQLGAHADQIGSIAFLRPDVVATGSADKTVAIHRLDHPEQIIMSAAFRSPIEALAVQPDGTRLAIAAGKTIHLWPLQPDGKPAEGNRLACRGHKFVVKAIAFSPDGRTLASAGEDGTLRFWDADTAICRSTFNVGLGKLRAVSFSPDGLTAAVAGDTGTIAIVDVDD